MKIYIRSCKSLEHLHSSRLLSRENLYRIKPCAKCHLYGVCVHTARNYRYSLFHAVIYYLWIISRRNNKLCTCSDSSVYLFYAENRTGSEKHIRISFRNISDGFLCRLCPESYLSAVYSSVKKRLCRPYSLRCVV